MIWVVLRMNFEKTRNNNQNLVRLPKLPKSGVGGDTDILIDSKYNNMYFPKPIFKLETELEFFVSVFVSPCGSRGIVSGTLKRRKISREHMLEKQHTRVGYSNMLLKKSGIFQI